MDLFFNRLIFIFKCLGLKHSKFIGYKMQMIPILGYLIYGFNQIFVQIFFGNY